MKIKWLFMFLIINQMIVAEEFFIRKHSFLNKDDLECVALFDSILFIGGDDEHLYRSFDFGYTWTGQELKGVNGDIDFLFQANNGTLLAGINEWDAHYITISNDKGESWDRVYKDKTIAIKCMFERKNGSMLAFGDDEVYLASTTDFTNWLEVKRPWIETIPFFHEVDIRAVKGLPNDRILLVGEDGFYTCYNSNMNKHFYGSKLEKSNMNFSSLVSISDSVFFAGTDEGYTMKSVDSGKTWTINYDVPMYKEEISKICFNSSGIGIAVGQEGLMIVTENWGETWERINSKTTEHFHDVITLNENTFFAIGDSGIVMSIRVM